MIPENQSGAIGASPLSAAMTGAIKGVDLEMPTEKHSRASILEERLLSGKPCGDGRTPELDLTYGGHVGYNPEIVYGTADGEATFNLNYGEALNRLKRGMPMARGGWNGRGMFVYYVPAASYPAQTGVAKEYFGEDALVPYNEYLAIKNASGSVSTWVASINDQMAEDWYVVNLDFLKSQKKA